tara:strand:- start:3239 stop:3538 length:300 start_codon:yes stop_codon:yes gene_type:complete
MVFTIEEMQLLQAINNKSPSEYTDSEKVIVNNICIRNKKEKVQQAEYFRKYLTTDKGKVAHRRASKKYYQKVKAEKKKEREESIEKNKDTFKQYLNIIN